ncbi:FG-GAP repeat-containing protein [Acidovorax delafieldii 2AN]|uniref:FG-GAP repeat-containing protein n=1 Tax=Acidovorax delafieldii 2AN TaxID=573060 RepID=C5T0Y3_ACIDE|nr:PilC/PilY family type IV pilus protein [Acidovorax delafieldii]EER61837.1 FG-GAP repeat-containing protein [Acidovorax delafieldii 2AN]
MPRNKSLPFQKNLLAIAIGAALTPAWALDMVQEPPLPTSKSAFVAPNVIISIDDSGSMNWGVKTTWDGSSKEGKGYTVPKDDRTWYSDAKRINVLKYALTTVFNDRNLIPENKLRIAWQSMNNGTQKNVNAAGMAINSMRPIDAVVGTNKVHRDNFLAFVNGLAPGSGTPLHRLPSQADAYMRRALNSSSPWATDPGGTGSKATEYLGCRRNYHILMTDGRWNGAVSGGTQDGTDWPALGNRQAYSTTSNQTKIYYDNYADTISDWAFKSWMSPLQPATSLKDSDKLKPSKIYEEAPITESFSATRKTGTVDAQPCLKWIKNKPKTDANCTQWTQQDVFGTKSVDLQKYWNPKYNPATWPHMVTYTIGFSDDAITWPGASDILGPSQTVPFGYDNSFIDLITGFQTWPDMDAEDKRALDLWHAAINGRGRFYAVSEAQQLSEAFTEIIGKINEESAPLPDEIAGGGSTSGYNVSQSNAGIFASVYSPKRGWSGSITATRAVEPEEFACPTAADPNLKCIRFPDTIAGWEGKSTADRLDEAWPADGSVDTRLVLSWSDDTSQGIPFKWSTSTAIGYSTAQKWALLGVTLGDTALDPLKTQGINIVNYIRGDRRLEGTTADKPLRVRYSRQGDVVNSEIWYTGRPSSNYGMGYSSFVTAQKNRTPILYVGGNDGMLHGFSATDGKELIAYVPRGVVGGLKDLTDKDYQHRYYVDGSPMTGDIKDGSNWKTLLVGTLGAGGKGYFLLNVTNPAGFGTASASELVVLDRTRSNTEALPNCSALSGADQTACNALVEEIKDIGNITAQPGRNPANKQEATQITRLNNGRWAVVMGNGYNSTNQRPVLLMQYLDGTDKKLIRIQATTDVTGSGNANDNGLASPALVDLDGDGKTDVVYAGDNLGNLWKFDLTSTTESDWKVAFGNNKPLFTARGLATATATTRDKVQPITAPPIVRPNDRSMTVGTGTSAKTVPVGGMMVAFGTGRNLTANDRRTDITQPVQTLYSVLDNTRYRMKTDKSSLEVHPGAGDCTTAPATCVPAPAPVGTMATNGAPLAKQTITTVSGDFATVNATQELKTETWKDYKGWYLDLTFAGERLLKPMQFFDGSNILAVYSESPSGTKNSESDNINESCVPVKVDTSAGSQFRTLVNIMDGKIPKVQLVDYDNNGIFNADDQKVARAPVKTGTPVLITKRDRIQDLTGGGGARDTLNRMPEQSMRPSWRQLK